MDNDDGSRRDDDGEFFDAVKRTKNFSDKRNFR